MSSYRSIKQCYSWIKHYPLPLVMVMLTAATALLFYFEYRREEQRLITANRTAFDERLNSLEMAVEQVVTALSLANNRAHNFWTAMPELRKTTVGVRFFYSEDGDYFRAGSDEGLEGNVFGAGKIIGRSAEFSAELTLAVDLLPWFKAAKEESDAIVQSYLVTNNKICSAYPAIRPKAVLSVGNNNMAAAFGMFYEPHQGRQNNLQRQPYFLDPYIDRTGQGLIVTYACPIYNGDRFVGVIATDISLAFIQSYARKIGGLDARLMLVDQNGMVLADSDQPEAILAPLAQRLPKQLDGIHKYLSQGKASDRVNKFYVTSGRLQSAPLSLIQIIPSSVLSKRLLLSQITFSIGLLVLIAFLSIAHFAIRKRRLEGALRESELRYSEVFNATGEAIFIHDYATGKILETNLAFEKLFGFSREDAPKLQIADLSLNEYPYRQADAREIILRSHSDGPQTFNWRCRRKDGTLFWTEVSLQTNRIGGKYRTIAVARDISDRKHAEEENKKLEARLYQSQKMEAIGTLAGGLAHDYNNLLMGILGNVSLMLMDIETTHPHYSKLRDIETYVKNGADLTRQMLGFARGGKYEVKPTDMNELSNKSSSMFAQTKKEISVHTKYQKDIWSVEVDQGQLNQVLLNLYVNAWQSMPDGGELYIETKNVVLDDNHSQPFDIVPGNYVKVSVTDTGTGMDESTRKRIFEPFFTTKEMGRGSGLGLASVYGIIKNHMGFINVYSEPGKGTTFNIYLPASEKMFVKEDRQISSILKGNETILLVDDEDMIINVGMELLKKLGYELLIARNGREAIEIYKDNSKKIDLVILDMVMPSMGGGATYDELKKINPDVKALLSSGYSLNGQATEILQKGCNGFIQKPFNLKELSHKIRDILDKG